MPQAFDLIVLGAGPAGLAAAIYAARARLRTLVVDESIPGGQVKTTHLVSNYPGFPEDVKGADLARAFAAQAERFGAVVRRGVEVTALELREPTKRLELDEEEEVTAPVVILATGARSRELGIEGERKFRGRGLSYCSTCDGAYFEGKSIHVIGGGNSALDAALQMSRIASRVYVLESSGDFTADKILVNRLSAAGNVEIYKNASVMEVRGGRFVEGIRFSAQGKESILPVRGVFVEIGLAPNSEFAAIASRNEKGEIKVDCSNGTGVPGLFAAGDVTDVPEKQIVIAAGDGAKAALSAARYLLSL